ncbi:MAG: PKD domain-containing protein, partial [Candidatus Thermoplasmatota archaeon]|nr:PKD domain-containing protein [Candidatus Thermoplasmatota archaeon]
MKKRQRIVIISVIILLLLGLTYPTIAEIEKMHDPRPPIARFEWDPEFPFCEHGVTFISKSVKGPGTHSRDIVSWEWSFGATGETAIHSWNEAGEYDVTLTVTCEIGLSNSVTHKVC